MPTALAALLGAALKGAFVVLLALAITRTLLRRRSAASRHAVWAAALASHLMLLTGPFLPEWRLTLADPGSWFATGFATSARGWIVEAWALWVVVALAVVTRYVLGTLLVARLAKTSERVEDGSWLSLMQRTANRMGITRPLTLMRGDRLGVPVTWGIVYPTVLLPTEASEWPEERRRFVLVHEMAHVKRFDALTQVLAQLAESVFWFSPLVWYAGRQARLERERACDDYVLRQGTRPSFYADELLGMVQHMRARQADAVAPAFAALAMARPSEFEGRMLAILDPAADRKALGPRGSVATMLVAVILALPLAAVQPFTSGGSAEAAIIERGAVSVPRTARRSPGEVADRPVVVLGRDDDQPRRVRDDRKAAKKDEQARWATPSLRVTPDAPSSPLAAATRTTDRDALLATMARITQLTSDGDKAAMLQRAMKQYLTDDDAVRGAWFRAAKSIVGDGDKAAVLLAVVPVAKQTCESAMLETLGVARTLRSDGDRATVLAAAARAGFLETRPLRTAYVQVARTLKSDGDYRAVMELMLGR